MNTFISFSTLLLLIQYIIVLVIFPMGIQLFWILELIKSCSESWLFKTSVITTIWLVLANIVLFLILLVSEISEEKEVENFDKI